jgi:dGTPase
MRKEVTKAVNDLFSLFMKQTDLLPKQWRADVAEVEDKTALARIVADYISGMTDRFALQEHKRLFKGGEI